MKTLTNKRTKDINEYIKQLEEEKHLLNKTIKDKENINQIERLKNTKLKKEIYKLRYENALLKLNSR